MTGTRFSLKPFVSGILVLAFLLRMPFFSVPLDYDEGTYAFFAFFSRGERFYPSLPIGRLPGIIFTYRFLDSLFPGQIAAFRIAAALLAVLATFGIYKLGRLLHSRKAGIFSALIFALFSSQISLDSPANTEFFMMPFTVLAFYLFWFFLRKGKYAYLALSGLSAGIAVFYKQVAVFEAALLGLWLVVENLEGRRVKVRSLAKQGLIFGISFLVPLLAALLFFALRGELADFWWQSFGSGGEYWKYAWSGGEGFDRLSNTFKFLWRPLWPFWLASLGGLVAVLINSRKENIFLLIWLVFALAGVFFNGWFFPHYFIQTIPPLSLLGGFFLAKIFVEKRLSLLRALGVGLAILLMAKNSWSHSSSFIQMRRGTISWEEHLENLGQETGDTGWLPFINSAQYLKREMRKEDTLFVWSTTPVSYYLTQKYPTTSFVYSYPFLDYELMLPTYRGWNFDFEANRQKLMRELAGDLPDYILADVNPGQVFDQMFVFGDFSNFVSRNYKFKKKFGNILVYRKIKEEPDFGGINSVPLEIIKNFAAITNVEEEEGRTAVTFEPMVNPGGILRSFKAVSPEPVGIDFEPLTVEFLGPDGYDFVGTAASGPSGSIDLHLRVKGSPKPVSFVRVKVGDRAWNNQHYGVNALLKVIQEGGTFDLYFEPPLNWQGKVFEVYFIYEDGSLAR